MEADQRVVAFIDADRFGVQLMRKRYPSLVGRACALVSNHSEDAKYVLMFTRIVDSNATLIQEFCRCHTKPKTKE